MMDLFFGFRTGGGAALEVTRIAETGSGRGHMWPSFLPDGRHFLYSEESLNDPQGESIYVGSIDGSSPKLIATKTAGNAEYAAGYLVYGHDHILWAQPFDLRRLGFSGSPTSLTSQELDQERSFSHAEFSVSRNGTLVFQSLSDSSARLTWFDIAGKEIGQIGGSGYLDPRLSPDGHYLVVASDDERMVSRSFVCLTSRALFHLASLTAEMSSLLLGRLTANESRIGPSMA